MKYMQDTGIDNVFLLEKYRRKMYKIFSAVQRQQRKSDVNTSFSLTACSAVYYHADSSLEELEETEEGSTAKWGNGKNKKVNGNKEKWEKYEV
jgi:hypothetical protein